MKTSLSEYISSLNEDGFDLGNINNYLSKAKSNAGNKIELNRIYNDIVSNFKLMTWRQIKFINYGEYYYPILPIKIVDLIKKMTSIDTQYTETKIGKWFNVNNSDPNAISLEVIKDYGFNRTHIVEGLPDGLKSLGIGYKIYRALIEKLKVVTSADDVVTADGDDSAARLWASIISPKKDEFTGDYSDDDLHVVFFNTHLEERVMVIVKTLSDSKKLEILDKVFKIANNVIDVDDELWEILSQAQRDQLSNRDSSGKSGKMYNPGLSGFKNISNIGSNNNTPAPTPAPTPVSTPPTPTSNSSSGLSAFPWVADAIDAANLQTNVSAILAPVDNFRKNLQRATFNTKYVFIPITKLQHLNAVSIATDCIMFVKTASGNYNVTSSRSLNVIKNINGNPITQSDVDDFINYIKVNSSVGNVYEFIQASGNKLSDFSSGKFIFNNSNSNKFGLVHKVRRTVNNASEGERVYVEYNPTSMNKNKARTISMALDSVNRLELIK